MAKSHHYSPASEANLVRSLLLNLDGYLAGHGTSQRRMALARELTVGSNVADVVALLGPKRGCPRLAWARRLSVAESVVLARIRRHGPQPEAEFAAAKLRSAIESLAQLKLVRVVAGVVQMTPSGAAQDVSVIAIEAKLRRWRDAIRQAAAYRRYADRAFVALPVAAAVLALRHRTEFAAAGVGLLVVSGKNVEEALPPASSTDHDWRREWVLSRLSA
jgi:hypothetical protein